MATVQIKNVPDDVARTLRARAARAGQSQQEFLLGLLIGAARTPTLDEALERIEHRSDGGLTSEFILAAQRAERDSH